MREYSNFLAPQSMDERQKSSTKIAIFFLLIILHSSLLVIRGIFKFVSLQIRIKMKQITIPEDTIYLESGKKT